MFIHYFHMLNDLRVSQIAAYTWPCAGHVFHGVVGLRLQKAAESHGVAFCKVGIKRGDTLW